MTNHETYREWLALAAAGALEEHEERELRTHASDCAECSASLEGLRSLASALKHLPTPQPRAEVVQRAIAQAARELAEATEQRERRNALTLALAMAWLGTLSSGALLNGVLRWVGATTGWGTSLAVMGAITLSMTVAVFCAEQAKMRVFGRRA